MILSKPASILSNRNGLLLWLFIGLLVGLLALSGESLWIDEGESALHVIQHSLTGLWGSMRLEGNSNMQIVWFHLYMWGWEKVFGPSEIMLRAANIPLLLIAVTALWLGLERRASLCVAALTAFLLNPFVWYYVSEMRPYAMMLSGACLLLSPIFRLLTADKAVSDPADSGSFWWSVCIGSLLLLGTSLVTLPWILFWGICLWYLAGLNAPLLWMRRAPLSLALCVVTGGLLGAYYLWTLKQNFRTAPGHNTVASMSFAIYEHLGFIGLGPGRTALREDFHALFKLPYVALAGGFGIVLLGFCGAALPKLGALARRRPEIVLCALLLLVPVPLVFLLGHLRETRILGRHIAPLAPLVSVFIGWAAVQLWRTGAVPQRLVTALLFLGLALSCVLLRYGGTHLKDDYRDAAAMARAATGKGERILWAADPACAVYYGLLPRNEEGTGNALVSLGLKSGGAPYEMVFLSKADLFDPDGKIHLFLKEHGYALTAKPEAFTIWTRH